MVEAAVAAGLTEVGISSHAPLPFATEWTMPPAYLAGYVAEVREAQRRYGDRISVLLGAELDFIPDPRVVAFQQEEVLPLDVDYFVGAVHFLGSGYPPPTLDGTEEQFSDILRLEYESSIQAMVGEYYRRVRQMLNLPKVRIVGHLDLIKRWNADRVYFRGDEPWYVVEVEETVQAIAAAGKIVELNTAGWRKGLGEPYPAPWILERCRDLGIPVTISSDAHAPNEVAWGFDGARACLAELAIVPVDLSGCSRIVRKHGALSITTASD